MGHDLRQLLDLGGIQHIMDNFCKAVGIAAAIIDLEGRPIVISHWQRICSAFHRQNPEMERLCVHSDTVLAGNLARGETFSLYKCGNGLLDAASPICIEGEHVANAFIGQFLIEPPDLERFRDQARRFGLDVSAYLEALAEVPILRTEALPPILSFLSSLARMLGEMGLQALRMAQSQLALKESEIRHRTILESSSDGILVVDAERRILACNEAFLNLFGYKREEVLGGSLRLVHGSDESYRRFGEEIYPRVNRDGSCRTEWTLYRKDGIPVPIETVISVMRTPGGAVKEFLSVLRDISERRRAEERTKREVGQLLAIFDSIPAMINVVDPSTYELVYTNRYTMEFLGGNPIGRPCYEVFHKISTPCAHCNNERFLREKDLALNMEYYSEPMRRHFMTTNAAIPWPDGRTLKLEFAVDITKRKEAEEALKKSEDKFRDLVENIQDVLFALDTEGRISYISPRGETLFAAPREELLGLYYTEFIHPEDLKRVLNGYQEREGEPLGAVEYRIVTRAGEIRWVRSSSRIVYKGVWPCGLRGILTDITETKRLWDTLLRVQKLDAVGTLAGGIAHDFNNLLAGILGRTSLLLLDVPSSFHPQLAEIEDLVKSASDLTRQLLGFAQGGKFEVRPMALNPLIRKTADMFGRTRKQVLFHMNLAQDLWVVEADQGQMEQVLMNLFVNARDAMPSGGEITVAASNVVLTPEQAGARGVQPGRYVEFSVGDTGSGMDAETMQRIFDPFFTTKEMGRGTGLGLATVYGIVKGHGGMIEADSEKGKGTTFTVRLPALEPGFVPEPLRRDPSEPLYGTETILLVDDEEVLLDIEKELLQRLGYQVLTASSGEEALRVLIAHGKDIRLVILDLIMPGLCGKELFSRMKAAAPEAKVLLSSGYSADGEAAQILSMGCDGFIQKPFSLHLLSKKVRKALGMNGVAS